MATPGQDCAERRVAAIPAFGMGDKKFMFDETESQPGGRLRQLLQREFLKSLGYTPNLSSPNTFNEKVLHRMLFDRRPILTTFADKLAVRDYVKQKLAGRAHIEVTGTNFIRADR